MDDALAFRVLRLAKPAFGVQKPLKFQLDEDMTSDLIRRSSHGTAASKFQEPFAHRTELQSALAACGVGGLMVLTKSFGEAYLGESFVGYISLGNKASYRATEVIVKVELQTSRQKVVLYDNTTSPLPFLGPGSRHDFIVQHDIKELGIHNLICSTVYTAADGERRYTPETFKFTSANPLYVKTKTRQVGGDTFMEACIENFSKNPMVLEYVRFDAAPPLSAVSIDIRDVLMTDFTTDVPLGSYIDQLQVLDVGCGSNYLFRLTRRGGGAAADNPGTALGKLEIKWRGSLGEVGRLQTQQILAPPAPTKEVEIKITSISEQIHLERPFQTVVKLQSHVDRQLGPLTLTTTSGAESDTTQEAGALQDRGMLRPSASPSLRVTVDGGDVLLSGDAASSSIVACGVTAHTIETLPPRGVTHLTLSFLPLALGVQQLRGLLLQGVDDSRVYDRLQPVDILVAA
ncbi:TPA: hypothetical protein ACH3X2_009909 [Trebouxia sp. C0005]